MGVGERRGTAAFGLRIPGREIPPAGGAAHRFACLRALAAFGVGEPRSGTRYEPSRTNSSRRYGVLSPRAAVAAHQGPCRRGCSPRVAVSGGIRLGLARRGRLAPPGSAAGDAGLAIALLFAQFHTFNGLSAGTALLSVAGLKLLETENSARYLHHHADHLFRLPVGAAGERFVLAAGLPRRRLLADECRHAASHHQRPPVRPGDTACDMPDEY